MSKEDLIQKLKSAREDRGLSIQDAARVLSIRVQILQDLEEGRYERLGAMIYVKSHIRKYADYLRIDREEIEPLLARLEDPFEKENKGPTIRTHMNDEKRMVHRSFFRWYSLILAIVLGVAVCTYFIYGEKVADIFHIKPTPDAIINYHENNQVDELVKPKDVIELADMETIAETAPLTMKAIPMPTLIDSMAETVQPVVANVMPSVDTKSALSEFEVDQIIQNGNLLLLSDNQLTEKVSDEKTSKDDEIKALLAQGISMLSITLNDAECWLQVKDKNNKVLLNEVLPANATYHLEGEAPFALHLGNARSIDQLVFNGDKVEEKIYRPTSKTTVSKIKLEPKEEN